MAEEGVRVETDLGNPKTFYVAVLGILRAIEYEQSQAGYDLWTRPNDTVGDQCGPLNTFVGTPADVFVIAFRVFENLVQCLIRHEPVQDHEQILLSVLAIGFSQALKANSANCKTLMETLANASRLRKYLSIRFAWGRPLTCRSQMAKAIWNGCPAPLQTRSNGEI